MHVDETEELAEEVGRKYLTGPGNIFLEGSRGDVKRHIQNLPGMVDRRRLLPTAGVRHVEESRGTVDPTEYRPLRLDAAQEFADTDDTYRGLEQSYSIISGTPKTVIPKIRHVLEYLRPGSICFWDGDGSMSHEDSMRSLRLMGEEVLPAVREMAQELDLPGPFDLPEGAEPAGISPAAIQAAAGG